MPSIEAMVQRPKTSPNAARPASAIVVHRKSHDPQAGAVLRRRARAVAGAEDMSAAAVAAEAMSAAAVADAACQPRRWRSWWWRWARRRRASFRHPPQGRHRPAGAAQQRSGTLSLPLQGQRSNRLCGRHGAGGAANRTQRSLARSRRIFDGRL